MREFDELSPFANRVVFETTETARRVLALVAVAQLAVLAWFLFRLAAASGGARSDAFLFGACAALVAGGFGALVTRLRWLRIAALFRGRLAALERGEGGEAGATVGAPALRGIGVPAVLDASQRTQLARAVAEQRWGGSAPLWIALGATAALVSFGRVAAPAATSAPLALELCIVATAMSGGYWIGRARWLPTLRTLCAALRERADAGTDTGPEAAPRTSEAGPRGPEPR